MRKMIFKRWALLGVLAIVCQSLTAARVEPPSAQAVAAQFLQSGRACLPDKQAAMVTTRGAGLRLAHVEPSAASASLADYYVFNTADGGAFVIVAGDDRARQVLGYGEGNLDMAALPCGLVALLAGYKEQMEWLHDHPGAQVQTAVAATGDAVAPMLTCYWSQSAPYYDQCPMYEGERCVTGCVATAMAQVMAYWRYPERAPSLSSYRTRSTGISVPSLPGALLDWENMADNYKAGSGYSDKQAQAVATLMRYCGQAVQMDYAPWGSGAYVYQQYQAMRQFGYGSRASQIAKKDYDNDQWNALMLDDLRAGRPILYAAQDPLAGGHAFVLDGYYDGKFHINWGWAGTGNGYFALDAFSVRGYRFNAGQEMLHAICPPSQAAPDDGYDFESGGIYYMYNEDGTQLLVTYKDTHYNSYSGDVVIPEQVTWDGETLPVTGIGAGAFRDCAGLTSVTLPATVTVIGDYALRNCMALTRIDLPDQVTEIGSQAFANCVSLHKINIPCSLQQVAVHAFEGCLGLEMVDVPSIETWLQVSFADTDANPLTSAHRLHVNGQEVKDLVIPSSVGQVKDYAFYSCSGLTSLTLESGVKAVGFGAFAYCSGLASLSLPDGLEMLDRQAFVECTGLTSVAIPSSITSLSYGLFYGCTGLKAVALPPQLTEIGNIAFEGCTSLVNIELPASITAIGESAFEDCSSLKVMALPDGLGTIGAGAFKGCSKLAQVQLPRSLTVVNDEVFAECSSLTRIDIPDGITAIGEKSFFKCLAVRSVNIGSGVQSIGDKAFYNNPLIVSVTSMALTPPEMSSPDCFTRSIYKSATLYVPVEVVKDYRGNGIWPWFKAIVPLSASGVPGDVNGDGEVNIADVNAVLDSVMNGESRAICDQNGDKEVNIADVNTLIDIIMK